MKYAFNTTAVFETVLSPSKLLQYVVKSYDDDPGHVIIEVD